MEQKYSVSFVFYNGTYDIDAARGYERKDISATLYEDCGKISVEKRYILAPGESRSIPVNGSVTLKSDEKGVYAEIRASKDSRHFDLYETSVVREGAASIVEFHNFDSIAGERYDVVHCVAEVTVQKYE